MLIRLVSIGLVTGRPSRASISYPLWGWGYCTIVEIFAWFLSTVCSAWFLSTDIFWSDSYQLIYSGLILTNWSTLAWFLSTDLFWPDSYQLISSGLILINWSFLAWFLSNDLFWSDSYQLISSGLIIIYRSLLVWFLSTDLFSLVRAWRLCCSDNRLHPPAPPLTDDYWWFNKGVGTKSCLPTLLYDRVVTQSVKKCSGTGQAFAFRPEDYAGFFKANSFSLETWG